MSERGLPPQVLTEIDSPVRESRLSAVDQLSRLAHGADLDLAAVARHALRHLTEDDSRSVAAAAAAALERSAVRLNPDRVDFGQVPPETPRLIADVAVEGPPLAVGAATITVSGPGLRAMLDDRRLRIVWLPRSEWLDGSVTVRGPAGWADVRVTGQVTAGPMSRAAVEARLRAIDGVGTGDLRTARVTVLPPGPLPPPPPPAAPRRRHLGTSVLIAALTALVLLGGAGVAWALVNDRQGAREPTGAPSLPVAAEPTGGATSGTPGPGTVSRVPLAQRMQSLAKPTVVGTIKVGAEPEGVAVSPDSRTVYVANQNSKVLSLVDAASRRVSSMTLRNTPRFVAVSRDGESVFVSMYETDKSGSGVAVVDADTRKVTKYLTTGMQPFALAVGPDNRLWVPIHSHARLEIFTAGEQRAAGAVEVPANPHAVAFSGDLMRAFTANHESNAVAVVDMRSDRTLRSVPVSRSPHSIAVSPDGRRVLVAGYEADAADLIDAVTLKRSGPFRVGSKPQAVAFATDGRHGYVVNEGSDSVSVLDGRTGKVTATVKVGDSPRTIAMSPDGRRAYVSNGADNTVTILRVGA
jgi:YVTN family beta-propeller protein